MVKDEFLRFPMGELKRKRFKLIFLDPARYTKYMNFQTYWKSLQNFSENSYEQLTFTSKSYPFASSSDRYSIIIFKNFGEHQPE